TIGRHRPEKLARRPQLGHRGREEEDPEIDLHCRDQIWTDLRTHQPVPSSLRRALPGAASARSAASATPPPLLCLWPDCWAAQPAAPLPAPAALPASAEPPRAPATSGALQPAPAPCPRHVGPTGHPRDY